MVYLYRKSIGGKDYYYLRASVRKKGKLLTKDIAYLGSDLAQVRAKLDALPGTYASQIRKTYRTLNRFIEVNTYFDRAKALKSRTDPLLDRPPLAMVEACRLHWQERVLCLDSATLQEALKHFVIEFAFNTTSLEGNTITLKEAATLLLENRTPANRTLREVHDVRNTDRVFFDLFEHSSSALTHDLIGRVHSALLADIDAREGYRTTDVRVFRARFKATPAPYVKADMDLLLTWLEEHRPLLHPFVLAVVFHHKFEKIHPFMDGNGRTGRMLMNLLLLQQRYPPLIIRKKTRVAYLDRLAAADRANLTGTDAKVYRPVVAFASDELAAQYWDLFL